MRDFDLMLILLSLEYFIVKIIQNTSKNIHQLSRPILNRHQLIWLLLKFQSLKVIFFLTLRLLLRAILIFLCSLGEFPVATDILESVLRRQPQCIEALVSLAAIHTQQAFTNLDVADSKVEQKQAKELYDQVLRLFAAEKDTSTEVIGEPKVKSLRISEVAHDPEMYLEIAKLYSDEINLDRSLKCYKEAAKITSEELLLSVSPKVLNNIGVLEYMRGNLLGAQDRFEEAATEAGKLMAEGATDQLDAVITAVTFNLGVVYEALGDKEKAESAFNQIISKHPEYVDGKLNLLSPFEKFS